MPKSMDRTARGVVCAVASLALSAALSSASAAPATGESTRIPFTERYHVTQHGGIARAANSAIARTTARHRAARPCPAAQQSGAGHRSAYRTAFADVDSDARTSNSSSARLRLPAGSRVSYARLYWGGNLRGSAHKRAGDNGRVLFAGPGGHYKQVLADTLTGRRTTASADGFQASADVTELVRKSGAGTYTVGRINVAKGDSPAGTWGGWTLVAAYENSRKPLRRIVLWDGFQPLGSGHRSFSVRLNGLNIPAHSHGRAGVVAYDADRGCGKGALSVRAGRHPAHRVHDAANPARHVMNSTITEFGRQTKRLPAHRNTLGFDSDVFDITPALRPGGDRLTFRFTTSNPGYLLGALFLQTDTRH
ncbi:DUF3344 domain-containing protein [Streptomyces angustmyceticus]|uniref:DUF3344 domain-containing protein n=2 Tax=Streptomyces angustmyceticus TaxID=285578 RepID=A0A5J4LHK5_9ACTN|nr:DUF3344 domain-containing protein [Streptomyces angustmyceticus]GES29675.1 hypothetical protein San01_21620 [Streptomyces angustmyceticus]